MRNERKNPVTFDGAAWKAVQAADNGTIRSGADALDALAIVAGEWLEAQQALEKAETEAAAWEAFCRLDHRCACLTAHWCCRRWPKSRRFRMYLTICAVKAIVHCIQQADRESLRANLAEAVLSSESLAILLENAEICGDTACKAMLLDYAGAHGLFPPVERL